MTEQKREPGVIWLGFVVVLALPAGCVAKGRYDAQVRLARDCRRSFDECKDRSAGQAKPTTGSPTQEALAALAEVKKEMMAQARIYRKLVTRFRKMIGTGALSVDVVHGRLVVKLRSAVLFDSGKDMLREEGKKVLDEVAEELKMIRRRHFQVAGHTDDQAVKLSRFKSNWDLSAARAVQVVKYLQARGVNPRSLSVGGYSEYQPVAMNDRPEGRQRNRRIEITLLPLIPLRLFKILSPPVSVGWLSGEARQIL